MIVRHGNISFDVRTCDESRYTQSRSVTGDHAAKLSDPRRMMSSMNTSTTTAALVPAAIPVGMHPA
jgi:hypothetical protein